MFHQSACFCPISSPKSNAPKAERTAIATARNLGPMKSVCRDWRGICLAANTSAKSLRLLPEQKTSVQHWTIPLHKRLITAFRESTQSWNHANYRYTEADWTKWKSNNSWKHWHCPIPFHFTRYLPSRINSESLSAGGCEATEPKSYNLDHCLHTKTWMSRWMRDALMSYDMESQLQGSHYRLRELHLVELEQVHVVGSGEKGTVKSLRTKDV